MISIYWCPSCTPQQKIGMCHYNYYHHHHHHYYCCCYYNNNNNNNNKTIFTEYEGFASRVSVGMPDSSLVGTSEMIIFDFNNEICRAKFTSVKNHILLLLRYCCL